MRKRNWLCVALLVLFCCPAENADSVVHKFQLWGTMKQSEKLIFYQGWTNGFFVERGPRGLELANCLDVLDSEQAIAMIDKQYKEHPENWSRPITEQIIEALTSAGPCAGKNPLPK